MTRTRTIEKTLRGAMAGGALLATTLFFVSAAAAEERTVNAFAAYQGEGKIYPTGENKGTFVGAIEGDLFVESDKGPQYTGDITCPGMLQIDLKTGRQAGSGQCTITAADGKARAFGVWSCRGVHLIGCNGRLMLVGGTGRAAGISGSGSLKVKTTSRSLVRPSPGSTSVTSLGSGVLVLRNFKLNIPSK